MEGWLDRLDASGRWALIKLVTGGLRIGVSARLAKQAVADLGGRPVNDIEEVWHGLTPPYADLFAWLEGRGPAPESTIKAPFRPVMLAQAIARRRPRPDHAGDLCRRMEMGRHPRAGGARGAASRGSTRAPATTSRMTFPDIVAGLDVEAALDGELLVGHADERRLHRAQLLRSAAAAEPQDGDGEAACQPPGVPARL